MASDYIGSPHPPKSPESASDILVITLLAIAGVLVLGGLFGAYAWMPGVAIVALAGLVALFFSLVQGAAAMNEPGNFGQGLTAVIAAVFVLPAAIGASVFLGVASGVSDALDDGESSYSECMADPDTTFQECQELE